MIEAGIAELSEKYADVKDCSNDSGLKACKKDYKEVRKFEIELDKKRKDLGEAARKHLDLINSEAKGIDSRLKVISLPHKQAFEAREAEIKATEEKRVSDIKEQIASITAFLNDAHNASADDITGMIEAVDMIDVSECFEEFTQEALKTKNDVMGKLGETLQTKLQQEELERARIKQEQQQAELDEQQRKLTEEAAERQAALDKEREITERIAALRMIPVSMIGASVETIANKLRSLESFDPTEQEFGGQVDEVLREMITVVTHLKTMLSQQAIVEQATESKEPESTPTLEVVKTSGPALNTRSMTVFVNDFSETTLADLAGDFNTEGYAAFQISFKSV